MGCNNVIREQKDPERFYTLIARKGTSINDLLSQAKWKSRTGLWTGLWTGPGLTFIDL